MGTASASHRNILVVYAGRRSPLRSALKDHLYSFQQHSGHRCYYLNVAVRGIPWYLRTIPFDLIVFHTLFLGMRGSAEAFRPLVAKLQGIRESGTVKVAVPQDEFIHSDQLCAFLDEFHVDHVFSTAPEAEWPKIYTTLDLDNVRVSRVLTGYLSKRTLAGIDRLAARAKTRSIDIGYRSQRLGPSTGRHGQLKSQLADVFQESSLTEGLATDISTRHKDVLLGGRWYEFLLKCKYTVGVEGGTSLLDRSGEIKERAEAYLARHPKADFAEVEAACFPDTDGNLSLFAISPRHLEACATRTCQILVEGDYNQILVAGDHYIELKRDFSNTQEVLDIIRRDDRREAITEKAYRDIVESGKYSYETFMRQVVEGPLDGIPSRPSPRLGRKAWERTVYRWALGADRLSWLLVALISSPRNILRRLLSEERFSRLSAWKRGVGR